MAWPDDLYTDAAPMDAGGAVPAYKPWLPGEPPPWLAEEEPVPPLPPPASATQPGLGVPAAAVEQAIASVPQPSPVEAELGKVADKRVEPVAAAPSFAPPMPADDDALPPLPSMQPEPAEDEIVLEPEYQGRDPLANPNVDEGAQAYADMDPEERAKLDATRAATQQQEAATRKLEEVTRNREQIEANERARQEALARAEKAAAEVDAEAAELAKTQIVSDRRPAWRKITGVLAAIVGGLVQSRQGGPNAGLEMIRREIDLDIEEQKANIALRQQALAAKRGRVTDLHQRAADEHRALEAHRIASWQAIEEQLAAEQQNYDPRGARAQAIGKAIGAARQEKAAARGAFQKQQFDHWEKTIKIEQEQQKIDETKRHNLVGERRAAAAAAASRAENVKQPPEYWKALHGIDVPIPMSQKEMNQFIATQKGIGELGKEDRVAAQADEKERLEREVVLPDGSSFRALGNAESVEKLREKVSAAEDIIRLMDEAKRIRTGWTSDSAKSDEWRQLKANWATAKARAKDQLGLGALTGDDMALVDGFIGTGDPTEYRDPSAGINKARENIINLTNTALKARGFKKKFDIPDINSLELPKDSDTDRGFKEAQIAPALEVGAFRMKFDEIIGESTKQTIEDLRRVAKYGATQEDKDKALAKLQSLISTGGNDAIKRAAQQAAFDALEAPSEEQIGPATATAKDEVRIPRGK